MQRLQIFVCKSSGALNLGLLRSPEHLADLAPGCEQEAALLTPPLPSSQAYRELELWRRRLQGPLGRLRWRFLDRRVHRPRVQPPERDAPDAGLLMRIKEVLAGRIVAEHRLHRVLRSEGYWPSQIGRALDTGVFKGEIIQMPGFAPAPWGEQICSRCGGSEARALPCRHCGSLDCLLCQSCSSLGEHRSCSTLLAVPGPGCVARPEPVELALEFELTPAQKEASLELLDFWEKRQGRALVWAACGAGKTEVAFALIQRALEEGHEVLFAIPRQDIVREVVQRLRTAFPGTELAAHFGGQPWLASGRLVAATTHQVLRFYRRFGLVVLDEVDAFPYQGSEMLRYGLERALAPNGQLVEMTATPAGRRPPRVITIPARHHGFPLPEPEIVLEKLPPWVELKPGNLPVSILEALGSTAHRWLVFAPTIAACETIQRVLAAVLQRPVVHCHSKLENRSAVVEDFRCGRLDVLVTTTVLERGVNFPGIGVMVLYADHSVFSASALVQIAGRVGRSAETPTGPVLFFAARPAAALREAAAMIAELNKQARERGLLSSAGLS